MENTNQVSLKNIKFLKSAPHYSDLPYANKEIAIIGYSNAGKSSIINAISNCKKMAYTSTTPGKTQMLNCFQIVENVHLIDCPGYGYAKVSKSMKQDWQLLLEDYLSNRQVLVGVIIVMDIRHIIKPIDKILIDQLSISKHIILSKADKVSKQAQFSALKQLDCLQSVQLMSITHKIGINQLKEKIYSWVE